MLKDFLFYSKDPRPTTTVAPKPTGPRCGPVCLIFCEFGNVLDARGCPTCRCSEYFNSGRRKGKQKSYWSFGGNRGPLSLIFCLHNIYLSVFNTVPFLIASLHSNGSCYVFRASDVYSQLNSHCEHNWCHMVLNAY